ncbi:MAG: mannose-1-phosphate guanylyltransferase, partial [Spirochaetaceae bacterium]|nr:mannose-1-phosphate guanylyltransferase [Spirochaetaceae bacterium]
MYTDAVILAGGSGTRLWPLSNSRRPKQFLPAPGRGKTFFRLAAERAFAALAPDGHLLIIAGSAMVSHVIASCESLAVEERSRITILTEPRAKNTAPALACAVFYINALAKTNAEKRTVLALSSDHIIEPVSDFAGCAAALKTRVEKGGLGVFGIKPSRAETGYGYIETERTENPLKKVLSFHEKPDEETARRYIESGNYFWNSGMFAFTAGFIAGQFRAQAPQVFAPFEKLHAPPHEAYEYRNNISVLHTWPELEEAYIQAESISFDYAIAEKCADVIMAESCFSWIDIGSWDEYALLDGGAAAQDDGNTVKSKDVFMADCHNTYIDSEIPAALCGI